MEKVEGIGGVFFRARGPKALAEWYRDHLGVALVPDNYDDPPWQQQAGPHSRRSSRTPSTLAMLENNG